MTERRCQQVLAVKPNSYYAKYMKQAITVEEMKAFFGLRLYMEYFVVKRSYASYWTSDGKNFVGETPGFNDVMCRDRFLAIWSFLKVMDEEDPTIDKTDKIYKVRCFFNDLIEKFQRYYRPHKHLSLDEAMIPSKNRLSIKQYIKDKPVKWGIKSFLLTDAENGYIMNSEIYTGSESILYPELGATGNVVARLLRSADLHGKGHVLVMDRYYNSVSLFEHLHREQKTLAVGTAMSNRKFFPKDLKLGKKAARGEMDFQCRQNISVCVWQDRKPIMFLSNYHDPTDAQVTNRRNKDGTQIQLPIPKAAKDYNQYMGGTDLNDQMTRLQKSRKHYRWPKRLIVKGLMWSIYNAYVIFRHTKQDTITKMPPFIDFLEGICTSLVGAHRSQAAKRARRVDTEERLQNVGLHMPEFSQEEKSNHECVVCTKKHKNCKSANPNTPYKDLPVKRSKTCVFCSECKVFLCLKKGTTCWSDYHLKVEYWR